MRAIHSRPELVGLSEQARGFNAQAEATRAGIRPQVGFSMGFIYLGSNNIVPQGIGAATFYADWTLTDSGATRRRAAAIQQQERAALKRREDTAADIALEVRTRWLDLQQARRRVPVAKLAIVQAEENINVITDRYRQQLSTYTEVLDAETRRVQSLSNFYNAVYDESLADLPPPPRRRGPVSRATDRDLTASRARASVTSTANPGSSRDVACSPRAKIPCYAYSVPSSVRTVIRPSSGSTIQYSGMPARAYSARFSTRSRWRSLALSLTTSITRSAPSK